MGMLALRNKCKHVKVYCEQDLLKDKPKANWKCLKCTSYGRDNIKNCIYTIQQLRDVMYE